MPYASKQKRFETNKAFNTELEKVNSWMNTSRLSLNTEKTVTKNFPTRKFDSTRKFKVNARTLKFVEFTKYLGVTIDRKLSLGISLN